MPAQMKPPGLRQRRNRESTARTLSIAPRRIRTPKLPADREWHEMTLAWWKDVWRSPMAAEYLTADTHGLFRLAVLVDQFWLKPSIMLAAEIRQQGQGYGLTPIDRRRLQWSVQQVEKAPVRPSAPQHKDDADPRALLEFVK